ncbi:ariadne RING finger, putative [Talaromyces stipitatus ATCC 10500]|uniref:RBR-type E3 ubiquitin transferase n=1 Tax=Talaromyces stipitatus (strain ATCC 10500 / CBS 375.48 / QM 6759 / NRRL 1006) TaxID=441959 RepID=B8MNV5_TALSN|nr:ariadne RING finger, putative [Talaromyces stipitatus ATCC 10500]EED14194.1 ariadne RING finger, putative [Talaromyces stipitatus ATCC 10500]
MSSRTHSGGHRSSTRRGHGDHSSRAEMNEENHESSRTHCRTGVQPAPQHTRQHRPSWMRFGGRTEPLVLLTTVKKSQRPALHTKTSSQGRGSASKQNNPDSSKDTSTRPSHTAQESSLKSSTESTTRKKQKQGPTSSLLSFFFSNKHTHQAEPVKQVKPVKKYASTYGTPFSLRDMLMSKDRVTCISCLADDIPATRAAKLACSHRMCYSCLRRLFTLSITDPQQHMPPRCCTQAHVPNKFQKKWKSKYKEYTTKDRYYCAAEYCGKWIKPSEIVKDSAGKPRYGKCSRCKTKICCLCRGEWHKNQEECPKDENIRKLEEMAKENGWQRCYSCSAIVELVHGCNHMTCRCKAQFCMKCAKPWKTCECPLFNDHPDREEGDRIFGDDAGWVDEDDDDFYVRFPPRPEAVWRRQEYLARQYIFAHRALDFPRNLRMRMHDQEALNRILGVA